MARGSSGAPIRVFVGTSVGEDAEACAALEYGIMSRASAPVDIAWMRLATDPASPLYSDPRTRAGWVTEQWSTPWTALRWAVPELCGFSGRAIYFDCPTLVLGDVAELAAAPMPDGAIVAAHREGATVYAGCLVWDCAVARRWVPPLADLRADVGAHQAMLAMLSRRRELVAPLPHGWGLRDADFSDMEPEVRSVHCASPGLQPHIPRALRRLRKRRSMHWFRGAILPHFSLALVTAFEREFAAALAAGYPPEKYEPAEPWGEYAIAGRDTARRVG